VRAQGGRQARPDHPLSNLQEADRNSLEKAKGRAMTLTHKVIIGVDEAGRGALAGPLVVAATAFPVGTPRVTATWRGVRGESIIKVGDSKTLTPERRGLLDRAIREATQAVAVIESDVAEIDSRLISVVFPEATRLVVARTVERAISLGMGRIPSDFLILLDGVLRLPANMFPCPVKEIPGGDKLSWQIGAASIVAKVRQDAVMDALHKDYSRWGFDKHRGYPTAAHKALLREMKPIRGVHRHTFKPVAEARGVHPAFEF
jgi:ribonuclease HII